MSQATTTERTESISPTSQEPGAVRRAPSRQSRLGLALLGCILVALAWLLAPTLRWAYDIERAGRLIDHGLAWPAPRQVSSLPTVHDEQALDRALQYLDDATRQRPSHPQAYRLAGHIFAARADWERAAANFERAHIVEPRNPLYAWEASLIYDQMQRVVEQAAREPLIDLFSSGHLIAPGQLVRSLYCNDQGAAACYLGRSAYTQPYAAFPKQPAVELPALFLHPPASVEQTLLIPADRPALSFAIGLDPVAREWRSDGATFRVWVTPAGSSRQLAAELSLDRATALRGWSPGWADLGAWAGQTVTLTLESHPGQADDLNDDWYGWGDLALTSRDAARYAVLLPKQHLIQ